VAVTAHAYNGASKHLTNGDVAYASDTIKAALLSAYTYAATHDTWADVIGAGTEASGSGYTARGVALGSKTDSTTSNVTTLGCANVVWTTSNPGTLAGAYIVFYKDTGTNSTSYVLAMADLGGTQTATNGGTFTYNTSAGVITFASS
jgi:hypothetical protein